MPTPGEQFEALIAIMDRLRDPGGCPWDQKQTMESLQPYLIEEAYECLDAMERGDRDEQCDELGDLLLKIVFQSRIASEDGSFTLSDVIQAISDRLIRRHPVFSDGRRGRRGRAHAMGGDQAAKATSRAASSPVSRLPALQRAARLGEKVSRVGLDWDSAAAVREKVNGLASSRRPPGSVMRRRSRKSSATCCLQWRSSLAISRSSQKERSARRPGSLPSGSNTSKRD